MRSICYKYGGSGTTKSNTSKHVGSGGTLEINIRALLLPIFEGSSVESMTEPEGSLPVCACK